MFKKLPGLPDDKRLSGGDAAATEKAWLEVTGAKQATGDFAEVSLWAEVSLRRSLHNHSDPTLVSTR